jgi:hypothetical protein
MSRRSQLAIIILIGLLLLGVGLYILLQPIFSQQQSSPQPPALPTSVQPTLPGQASTSNPSTASVAVSSTKPVTPEGNQLLLLEQKGKATVERIGSGASGDGFLGYADVLDVLTSSAQKANLAQQKVLQQAHPASGPLFGLTTHAVSSHIKTGSIGDATLVDEVQAIQNEDAGDPTHLIARKGKIVTVTFKKQTDGSYLIDSLDWADKQI